MIRFTSEHWGNFLKISSSSLKEQKSRKKSKNGRVKATWTKRDLSVSSQNERYRVYELINNNDLDSSLYGELSFPKARAGTF